MFSGKLRCASIFMDFLRILHNKIQSFVKKTVDLFQLLDVKELQKR